MTISQFHLSYGQKLVISFERSYISFAKQNSRAKFDGNYFTNGSHIQVKSDNKFNYRIGAGYELTRKKICYTIFSSFERNQFSLTYPQLMKTGYLSRELNINFGRIDIYTNFILPKSSKVQIRPKVLLFFQKPIGIHKSLLNSKSSYREGYLVGYSDVKDTLIINKSSSILPLGIGFGFDILFPKIGNKNEISLSFLYDQTIGSAFGYIWYWPNTNNPINSNVSVRKNWSIGLKYNFNFND